MPASAKRSIFSTHRSGGPTMIMSASSNSSTGRVIIGNASSIDTPSPGANAGYSHFMMNSASPRYHQEHASQMPLRTASSIESAACTSV